MPKSLKTVFWTCLTLSVILSTSGCDLISLQDPTKLFADGKWPKILEKLSSQTLELRNRDQIVARVEADQQRTDLLRVAVMDAGVDYTNPDLVDKIAFGVKDGQIVSAGYDVMGHDNFASPQLIDASLFAFGASDIVDGKIANPPANPLDLLMTANQDFEQTLKAKIMADPDLAQSFYAKMLNGSINIVGAYRLTQQNKLIQSAQQKSAQANKVSLSLTKPPMDPSTAPAEQQLNAQLQMASWLMFTKLPLILNTSTGLPQGMDNSTLMFEQYDKFATALTAAFNEVDQRQGFSSKVATFMKFNSTMGGAASPLGPKDLTTNLSMALAFKKYGPSVNDPARKLNLALRDMIVTQTAKSAAQDWSAFTFNATNISTALDQVIDAYSQGLQQMAAQADVNASDKIAVKSELGALPQLKSLKNWYITNRGWEKVNLSDENNKSMNASLYRRLLYRSTHPFLAAPSATTSHGTHVSGIIANQDPRIRIFPVRVLTQSVLLPDVQKVDVANQFTQQFSAWLQNPLIFKAASDLLRPLASVAGDEGLNSKDPQQFATAVGVLFKDIIQQDVSKNPLNYLFINDVIEAIKVIGQRKIKIANVSLGTEFQAPVVDPHETNTLVRMTNAFKLLQTEYFKYSVAGAMKQYAANTIFVVANGNSGKWVDGRSQSALPVDLSSPFLEKYENPKTGLVAPNNQITNVVGVGSLAADGHLSSFTNIMISKKTPFVMAEGESVLSPVRVTDQAPVNDITQSYLSAVKNLGKVTRNFNIQFDGDPKAAMAQLDQQTSWLKTQALITNLVSAVNMQMVVEYSDHRALMSGTSMASPTVAGLIARDLIAKAAASGKNPDTLYDDPDFAPTKVIHDTLARATSMAGEHLYIPLRKLTGEIRPDHGDSIKTLMQGLDGFLKNSDTSALTWPTKSPTALSCEALF